MAHFANHLTTILLGAAAMCGGCVTPAVEGIGGIDVLISDAIPTVATVSWSTSSAQPGYVEFGPTEAYGTSTPSTGATTEHEVTLLGMTADSEYHFRVVTEAGSGKPLVSADQTLQTGTLGSGLPPLDIQGDTQDGFLVTTLLGATKGPAILDADGELVWFHSEEEGGLAFRALLSNDGQSILYGMVDDGNLADTAILRVSLDGTQRHRYAVPYLTHDFVELPDGTIAAIAADRRTYGEDTLAGDRIVELAADGSGSLREIWNAWDWFDPSTVGDSTAGGAWTHTNALDYDPASDTYTLSMRNLSSILQVDRQSGDILWALGGDAVGVDLGGGTPIVVQEGSHAFEEQHQFEFVDGGIIIFDNGESARNLSVAVEYDIDWDAGVATEAWTWSATPSLFNFALGDVHRIDGGDTLVDWSSLGMMQRVTPEGEVPWQVNSGLGNAFGYVQLVGDLYTGG